MALITVLRALVTTSSLALAACGGNAESGPPPPDTGEPPVGAIEITGGERLGWNQLAPSLQTLRSYSFKLYVDRTPADPGLSEVQCGDTAGPTGYECSGLLPTLPAGTRVLQLSTTERGQESPRSAELTVTVVRRLTAPTSSEPGAPSADGSSAQRLCFEGSAPPDCYVVEQLAGGLGDVRDLTAASGGRVYFIEDNRDVRVLANGVLLSRPVFRAPQATILSSLAVDAEFERNRFVYTALITESDGRHALHVARHRDVGNELGQAAVIVTDLPVASPEVRIAFGPDRYLYVAMPAPSANTIGMRTGPYDGFVLRFNEDGTVPHDARGGSPIFGHGYDTPTDMIVGPARLWIAGTGVFGGGLAWVDVARERREWPRVPEALRMKTTLGPTSQVSAASAVQHSKGATLLYTTVRPSSLHRLELGPASATPIDQHRLVLPSPPYGDRATAVEALTDGVIVLASAGATSENGVILQLLPH
jgi:hypothetical protein